MKDYKNMVKEEVIELLQKAVWDKKKKLLEDVKACLNINNRNLGYDISKDIFDSLSDTTVITEDCEKSIDYVEEGVEGVWLPLGHDEDVERFGLVAIDVYKIRGLERLIGYLS